MRLLRAYGLQLPGVTALACALLDAGGIKRYLLSTLAGNPNVHTECFWAFTFAFAFSSSYLNADDFVNVKEVVTKCLLQFAGYLAGVGIPGMLGSACRKLLQSNNVLWASTYIKRG